MERYESPLQALTCTQAAAYAKLSDLRNLEAVKDRLPQDKVKDMTCDVDSCSVTVDPVGRVTLRIVERQPEHTVQFGADNAPIDFHLYMVLTESADNKAQLQVKLEADIPFMIKTMIGSKIDGFVQQFAEMTATMLNVSHWRSALVIIKKQLGRILLSCFFRINGRISASDRQRALWLRLYQYHVWPTSLKWY